MLGFVAEVCSTEIIIDRGEPKTPAGSRGDRRLPRVYDDPFLLPRLASITRRLVEDWLHGRW